MLGHPGGEKHSRYLIELAFLDKDTKWLDMGAGDGETGLCVTRARLGNVTFWVKYTETETGYLVHRAYSHRMTIQTR